MTVFDLEPREGSWFDMDGGGRVQLKALTPDDWKAIRRQSEKQVPEYQKLDGKWERFEVTRKDDDLQNEIFWDRLIVAWENLKDGKGADIPCTPENKTLLMMTQPKFSKFVSGCIDALTATESARVEALEKN